MRATSFLVLAVVGCSARVDDGAGEGDTSTTTASSLDTDTESDTDTGTDTELDTSTDDSGTDGALDMPIEPTWPKACADIYDPTIVPTFELTFSS
jgi:hypothetical protein